MGWEKSTPGKDVTYACNAVFAEKFVVVSGVGTAETCKLPTGGSAITTDIPLGVTQNTTAAIGESVNVRVSGQTKAVANAAISLHTLVGAVITTGRVATLVGSIGWSATDVKPVGYALEAAAAAGEILTLQLLLSS
jgi:hypothetical protein